MSVEISKGGEDGERSWKKLEEIGRRIEKEGGALTSFLRDVD